MDKYEYKEFVLDTGKESTIFLLNKLGQDGWRPTFPRYEKKVLKGNHYEPMDAVIMFRKIEEE